MKKHAFASPAFLVATLMIALGFAFGPSLAGAQGTATPSADAGPDHPAHIHEGTCADLGKPKFPLDDLVSAEFGGNVTASNPVATPEDEDLPASETTSSTTKVDASLDDLLASDHAINIHLSPDQADVFIACGDITGTPKDGSLEIDLKPVDDSGYSGKADLLDNGDGTTAVTVTLDESGVSATPMASPAS